MSKIKLGLTLYCFTAEYARGKMTLEDCIRTAKEMGYQGYEIVATQMIPSYPYISDEFLEEITALNQKYGMEIVSYAANMDCGLLPGRSLTEDEMLSRAIIDVQSANRLGCTVMREQYLCGPNVLRRLAPIAEQYGVHVGIEIHNPETPSTPIMQEYYQMMQEVNSPYIGFIPDFGCFATKPNKPNWDEAVRNGADEKLLEMAAQCRADNVPMDEAAKRLLAAGANGAVMGAFNGMYGFVTFYPAPDLEGLKRILPYCVEMHGKFHYIHEDLHEHSIPYEQILPVLADNGYEGYIMTEYEDHVTGDTLVMMQRHIDMEKKILGWDK